MTSSDWAPEDLTPRRRFLLRLLLSLPLLVAGVVILHFWLFPVVSPASSDSVLISQNPAGLALAMAGSAGTLWSLWLAVRNRLVRRWIRTGPE